MTQTHWTILAFLPAAMVLLASLIACRWVPRAWVGGIVGAGVASVTGLASQSVFGFPEGQSLPRVFLLMVALSMGMFTGVIVTFYVSRPR